MRNYVRRHGFVNVGALLLVSVLVLTVAAQPVGLTLENVKTWYWTNDTRPLSLASADIDSDGVREVVTGGWYDDGDRYNAQLCVWNGVTLALENVRTWYWTSNTRITSVAIGNVDGDGVIEIITGGYYRDGTRDVAQLCVWNAITLALENVQTWYWMDDTQINSIAAANVDGDGSWEIVTGGRYLDGTHWVAQLCVWSGPTLALEQVKTWLWIDSTEIDAVGTVDVDGDASMEIVTGGFYDDDTSYTAHFVAQLCVWDGATLALENVKTWYWTGGTQIFSVLVGNVDSDVAMEIVTGGDHYDGSRHVAQLCVWDGATLALESVKTWYWTDLTQIFSVAKGDVDGDVEWEIVTGGRYFDSTRFVAQLCVWDGSTLALEKVETWYWTNSTSIDSVAVGNVDGDGQTEIITGGYYMGIGSQCVAQLCVWAVPP